MSAFFQPFKCQVTGMHDMKTRSCFMSESVKAKPQVSEIKSDKGRGSGKARRALT